MRRTFTTLTLLFGLALGLLLARSGAPPAPGPQAPALTLAEVARHAQPKDCWMVIDGQVYGLSAYVDEHPADPEVLTRHCGQEASQAFATKDVGRPHSDRARRLLAAYRLGPLLAPNHLPRQP